MPASPQEITASSVLNSWALKYKRKKVRETFVYSLVYRRLKHCRPLCFLLNPKRHIIFQMLVCNRQEWYKPGLAVTSFVGKPIKFLLYRKYMLLLVKIPETTILKNIFFHILILSILLFYLI